MNPPRQLPPRLTLADLHLANPLISTFPVPLLHKPAASQVLLPIIQQQHAC